MRGARATTGGLCTGSWRVRVGGGDGSVGIAGGFIAGVGVGVTGATATGGGTSAGVSVERAVSAGGAIGMGGVGSGGADATRGVAGTGGSSRGSSATSGLTGAGAAGGSAWTWGGRAPSIGGGSARDVALGLGSFDAARAVGVGDTG
jgi:hypothetical protein